MRTALSLAIFLAGSSPLTAQALSACSSDGQPRPMVVVERFISADCASCWAERPALVAGDASTLTVDWIVPTPQGDDAPLSAAATREALQRLQELGRPAPTATDTHIADLALSGPTPPAPASPRLRVAHGPAIHGYVGTGSHFSPVAAAVSQELPYTLTLLLVESLSEGTEGSSVSRNLVRNSLQRLWDKREQLSIKERISWTENRVMGVPEGAHPDRLRLVGWVQDARGRIVAGAQSVCAP